ncbi:MAG: L-type lectin-domain containing protein, partial [Terriglobales bacterium]
MSSTVLRLTDATGSQVGSSWFNTPQPVKNGFSTSFQFQFTSPSEPPADGIAFVIQNAPVVGEGESSTGGLHAIGFTGGNGGALGYGDRDTNDNPSTGEGIPNSIAIEFDSYKNGWDNDAHHVAVQSCGTGRNTSHHNQDCSGVESGPNSTLGSGQVSTSDFGTGLHKVTITYTPPTSSGCGDSGTMPCPGSLHVILDNTDLFPGGISVDLGSLLSLGDGGTAFVGFTGATGGSVENQDILNWTFTPQAQSAPVTTNTAAILEFNGGPNNTAYNYNAILTGGDGAVTSATVTVKPILIDEEACEKLVDANPKFGKAQCFVY